MKQAWEEHRTSAHAADFVGTALVLDSPESARDAAEFLLRSGPRVSPSAKVLAASALGILPPSTTEKTTPASQTRIRELRTSLSEVPRDPLAWLDLAWEESAAGHNDHAKRAVRTALALAPDHRVVLRAATRFFIHLHQPDYAHDLLRRAKYLQRDPWLLAAEIATADVAGRTSRHIKLGRTILESRSLRPIHLSELAAAIGTLELASGSRRKARRLFDLGLVEATENTLAQYTWAAHWLGAWEVSPDQIAVPNAFEAITWERFHTEDWRAVIESAGQWHRDEPFSGRPAVVGSGVAINVGDLAVAERLARQGLAANPNHQILLNNLSVALVLQDRTDEAIRQFEKVRISRLSDRERITFLATAGLLSYRTGNLEQGRRLYDLAIQEAESKGLKERKATALIYKIREEIRTGSPDAAALLVEVERAVKQVPTEQLATLQNSLRSLIAAKKQYEAQAQQP